MSGSCSNLSAASCSSNDINERRDSLLSPGSPLESADLAYKRLEEENKLLKGQVETLKGKVQSLLEENKSLRMASVSIQVRAEQEEEYISNTLLKRIEVRDCAIDCLPTGFGCSDSPTAIANRLLSRPPGTQERERDARAELRAGGGVPDERPES